MTTIITAQSSGLTSTADETRMNAEGAAEGDGYLVNPSVSHGSLEEDDIHEVETMPRPVFFMKIIEIIFACGCLGCYSHAAKVENNFSKVGLCWATFGSQIIIMVFGLIGFNIGEITPKLSIGHNGVGAILYLASGACNIESWWDHQESAFGLEIDPQTDWNVDMLLLAGILALMNSALLFADTLVATVLWRLSQQRRANWP